MMTTQRKPTAAELDRFVGPAILSISGKSLLFVDHATGKVNQARVVDTHALESRVLRANRATRLH